MWAVIGLLKQQVGLGWVCYHVDWNRLCNAWDKIHGRGCEGLCEGASGAEQQA
jgi:hypothetical protein